MPRTAEIMEKFKKEYDLDLTFEQVESTLKSFKQLDKFMHNKTNNESKSTEYVLTLANLLNNHLEKKLSPLYYRRSLDLTDVNVKGFINDFEKIMANRRDENDTSISPEPFAGLGSKLYDKLIPHLQILNKPVTDLWVQSILDGKLDPMDLKHSTNSIFEEMRDKRPPLTNVEERTLEVAVLTHKAMKQVYKKRTLWKVAPWHWRQWYREAKYINKLGEQLQAYRQNGLPIEKIERKYSVSHIHNIANKLTNIKNAVAKEEAEERNRNAEEKQALVNQKVSATENLKQITSDPTFKDKFIDDVVKSLPQTQFTDSMKKDTLSMAYNNIVSTMKIQNANFDDEFGDPKKYVAAGARTIFKSAYVMAKTFDANSREKHLAIAQIITDKVMQKLSPAAVDQKYSEFANGYALRHEEEFNNALGNENKISDEEVTHVFADARKIYGELTREPFIPSVFTDKLEENIVEPIKENPNVIDNTLKK